MAGAGYKLFATGDVLTAAQVNTYLMQQTVMVFASSAARTSALSGVIAEGMLSYLSDTNALQYYDGAAWQDVSNPGDITGVTAGTGLSGGGTSGSVTLAIDSTVATLTGSQTLTNKTLTSPVITTPKIAIGYSAKTAAYTVASGDEGYLFSMNNAATQQFNIPTDATFNFAIGTEIHFVWITGAGQPTIGAVTPGTTTVISTGATSATPKLRVANSAASAIKLAANSWLVVGDLA
jgi:trimeric autotransporter adhesin